MQLNIRSYFLPMFLSFMPVVIEGVGMHRVDTYFNDASCLRGTFRGVPLLVDAVGKKAQVLANRLCLALLQFYARLKKADRNF